MRNKKGFTLVEMLVVVLIIGILAAIALPQYTRAVDRAKYSGLMNIARAMAEANERYYMVHDRYSTNIDELDVDIPANSISGSKAYFDWGYCQLFNQGEAICYDMVRLRNIYTVYYQNSSYGTTKKNHIYCAADTTYGDDSRYVRLCKSYGPFSFRGTCYYNNETFPCAVYTIR